jgi:hypothetical protein
MPTTWVNRSASARSSSPSPGPISSADVSSAEASAGAPRSVWAGFATDGFARPPLRPVDQLQHARQVDGCLADARLLQGEVVRMLGKEGLAAPVALGVDVLDLAQLRLRQGHGIERREHGPAQFGGCRSAPIEDAAALAPSRDQVCFEQYLQVMAERPAGRCSGPGRVRARRRNLPGGCAARSPAADRRALALGHEHVDRQPFGVGRRRRWLRVAGGHGPAVVSEALVLRGAAIVTPVGPPIKMI